MKIERKWFLTKLCRLMIITVINTYLLAGCNSNTHKRVLETSTFNIKHKDIIRVSLTEVLSEPKKYNGKTIQISGFLRLQFEGNTIFLSKEDYERGIDSNCLWVEVSKKQMDTIYKTYNKKNVLINGVFDMNNKGHMRAYKGSIINITQVKLD